MILNAASSVERGRFERSHVAARCTARSRSEASSAGMYAWIARTAVAVAVNRLPECGGRKSDVVQCPSSSCHRAMRAAQVAVARSAGSRASCAAISR